MNPGPHTCETCLILCLWRRKLYTENINNGHTLKICSVLFLKCFSLPSQAYDPADDWSEHISSSGKKYYYNCRTEVSQWEKPKEWLERYTHASAIVLFDVLQEVRCRLVCHRFWFVWRSSF